MNFWQGKKVRLRGIEPSDAEHFQRWNQDSERNRSIDFVWPPTSYASAQAFTEASSKQKLEDDRFQWVVENRAGEVVGNISTHDCRSHNGTFSYALDIEGKHRRNGYASEAIFLVLKYYFEELRYQKVTVPVHSDNAGSIALHHHLGFVREGVFRRMNFTGGRFTDNIWFGMTSEEFAANLAQREGSD